MRRTGAADTSTLASAWVRFCDLFTTPNCEALLGEGHEVTAIDNFLTGNPENIEHLHEHLPAGRVLPEVAAAANKTIPQVVLNWCLSREGVVVIPKGSSVKHVLDNCDASGWRLSSDLIKRLENGVRFRQRGALDRLVRKAVPRPLGPLLKNIIKFFPPGLRRRLT